MNQISDVLFTFSAKEDPPAYRRAAAARKRAEPGLMMAAPVGEGRIVRVRLGGEDRRGHRRFQGAMRD